MGILDFLRRRKRKESLQEMHERLRREHNKRVHAQLLRQRDSLIPALKSPDVVTRRKAAGGFKYYSGTPEIRRALREALKDPDANVRADAAISLWEIERHGLETRRTLEQMLLDEMSPGRQSEYVRRVLCDLLGKPYV